MSDMVLPGLAGDTGDDFLNLLNYLEVFRYHGGKVSRGSSVSHQREAVDFLTRREHGDLPQSLSLWERHYTESEHEYFQHVITGIKSTRNEDFFGRILADDVGLGKTLSILSTIVGSADRALSYAIEGMSASSLLQQSAVRSKATLVIVPSALLIDSWIDEICEHILPGAIKFHKYHHHGKSVDFLGLLQNDVVLTTYATVAADFCRGRSILDRIDWYRIVLDEAHMIRNWSTKQFRAVSLIPAHIRWCLTGTPIQNSLDDLGALLNFLRVPIFNEIQIFRKHIIFPTKSKGHGRFSHLRRLMELVCLRRTRTVLGLPEPSTETIELSLSSTEVDAYSSLLQSCRRAIDMATSGRNIRKANQIMLEALLRTRLLCNNGPRAYGNQHFPLGFPKNPEEAVSYLQTLDQAVCSYCSCEVSSLNYSDDKGSGTLTVCHHLLCSSCVPRFKADLEDSCADGRANYPFYTHTDLVANFIVLSTAAPEFDAEQSKSYPTKLLKVLDVIKSQPHEHKSVVFSFWKTTLDILSHILKTHNILHFRIDGSQPWQKRRQILSEFQTSERITVLLMTLGTGAVGLNKLAVANRIHIIEPQWNPSVESQAIGRILRLGQKKSVSVIRYIMEGTVEKSVQSRQLRKLLLSRGGFNAAKGEHTIQQIEEMMSLLRPEREE